MQDQSLEATECKHPEFLRVSFLLLDVNAGLHCAIATWQLLQHLQWEFLEHLA
jgi:hypothetical protein